MRPVNDVFRFLLEMALLAALAYWGFHDRGGVAQWVLGLGAPLLLAVVWGAFMAPKAARPARDPVRLPLEIVLFGSGVAALAAAGSETLAAIFGACVLVHLALTFPLGQRG
jgi:hypothetical protein